MMRRLFILVISMLVIGAASLSPAAAMGGSRATIVGRWQQSHTCDQLVRALNSQGPGGDRAGDGR